MERIGTLLSSVLKPGLSLLPGRTRQFLSALKQQRGTFKILSTHYAQFRTFREKRCLDSRGQASPWYTYPATEYLSHLDYSRLAVLEYGSGESSLWWADRCLALTSVEHDVQWYARWTKCARNPLPFECILATEPHSYAYQRKLQDADVVIVDGVHRALCARAFLESGGCGARPAAMLIFDNSDWYPQTIAKLRDRLDWVQVDFHGFGPLNCYTWTTSVFINPRRVRDLNYTRPLMSIAGIHHAASNADDAC